MTVCETNLPNILFYFFVRGKFFKEHAPINEMDRNFLLNGSYTESAD